MNKPFKIILNILIFLLIAGFGYYMIHSMMSKGKTSSSESENQEDTFVSPYKKANSFDAESDIISFCISKKSIYVAQAAQVSIFSLSGRPQSNFQIEASPRDIVVEDETMYLLYPTRIVLYSLEGQKQSEWKACGENTDYCSFTTTEDYVFVADAENKHICQYDKQGRFVRFIKSPEGFVIPSYSFGIISINDTIYCSNSGRHRVESYTLDGEFITSFGAAGTQAEAFSGCCNPVYLEKGFDGNILTSEKGNPRISYYGKNGKFRAILFDSNMLGGGADAYKIKVSGENIYIANGKTISGYYKDGTCPSAITGKSCAECEAVCPFGKK